MRPWQIAGRFLQVDQAVSENRVTHVSATAPLTSSRFSCQTDWARRFYTFLSLCVSNTDAPAMVLIWFGAQR